MRPSMYPVTGHLERTGTGQKRRRYFPCRVFMTCSDLVASPNVFLPLSRQRGGVQHESKYHQPGGCSAFPGKEGVRPLAVKLLAHGNTRRSTMRQNSGETREVSRLELWRRASRQGDLEAWAAFQQGLEGALLTWFHAHPGCEVASRVQSDRYFVARAFEQLWHLIVQGQVACETLSEAVVYLRVSLNGAILETLRDSQRPSVVLNSWPEGAECPERGAVWDELQAGLSNQRERRLAYLLYQCGLEPAEIEIGRASCRERG